MTIGSSLEPPGFVIALVQELGREMVMSLLPEVLEQLKVFASTGTEGNPLELMGCLWLTTLSVFALK